MSYDGVPGLVETKVAYDETTLLVAQVRARLDDASGVDDEGCLVVRLDALDKPGYPFVRRCHSVTVVTGLRPHSW